MSAGTSSKAHASVEAGARLLSVIEVGTTSLRMLVAQATPDGRVEHLEQLNQPVSLGKDTFTRGVIEADTTEECVRTLRNFKRVLDEYQIQDPEQIAAIATSAVREASNRDAFLDRIFIATGIYVEVIDESEVSRYTYIAISPLLNSEPVLRKAHTLAVEVGGGSTETLVLSQGQIVSSQTYRLGSLRLNKMLEDARTPRKRLVHTMNSHVERSVGAIRAQLDPHGTYHMLALGGEARFAVGALHPDMRPADIARLSVSALEKLTYDILHRSADDVVRDYHISYPEAETMGPALLILVRLAGAFGVKSIRVGFSTLRDGVLAERAAVGPWRDEFREQIVHSAVELGKKYHFDQEHARRAADFCHQLFEALQQEHDLSPRYELILTIAALLHDIGLFISNRSHHKHSYYLVRNSDLFGLGSRDLQLVALTVRYHRRGLPKPTHPEYMALSRDDRVTVKKLAAILRVADALDRGQLHAVATLRPSISRGDLLITLEKAGDLTLEQHALRMKGPLFEQVFGMRVRLRNTRRRTRDDSWNVDVS